jgi:hypothetical protein
VSWARPAVRTSARWDSIEATSANADDWTKTDRIVADAQAHGDTFLADLYAAGAKGFFDGVSYHSYTWPQTPSHDSPTGGWNRMLKARQTMVDNGDGAKKIWVTEFGAPTAGSPNAVTTT